MRLLVPVFLLLGFLTGPSLQQSRDLLSRRVIPTGESQGGVPDDGSVFLTAETCSPLPPKMRPQGALMCQAAKWSRECMGTPENEPIFFGRNCSGAQCTLRVEPGPDTCVLSAFDTDFDPGNETRIASCGFEPVYFRIMMDTLSLVVPHSDDGNCFYGLPPDVKYNNFLDCIDGTLRFETQLIFPEAIEGNYTCFHNLLCDGSEFSNHITCYTHGNGTDAANASPGRPHILVALVISYFIWVWLLLDAQ